MRGTEDKQNDLTIHEDRYYAQIFRTAFVRLNSGKVWWSTFGTLESTERASQS